MRTATLVALAACGGDTVGPGGAGDAGFADIGNPSDPTACRARCQCPGAGCPCAPDATCTMVCPATGCDFRCSDRAQCTLEGQDFVELLCTPAAV